MRKKAYIKFFRATRRVLMLTTVKNVGQLGVQSGGYVTLKNDAGQMVTRSILDADVRTLSLGLNSKHSIVIGTFRYANQFGTLAADAAKDEDLESLGIRGITARLKVTITNTPTPTAPVEAVEVDEEEPESEEEPGDNPGG